MLGARILIFVFFSFFFAMGSAFFFFVAGLPLARIAAARGWEPASCEIVSSEVTSHQSEDSTTYRVDVKYRYFVDDQAYTGDRYRFSTMSTSGYEGKAAVVARLRPGTRADCWVNPSNAAESVLERGPTLDLFVGLFPLIFVAIGAGGMYAAIAGRVPFGGALLKLRRRVTAQTTFVSAAQAASPAALRPTATRVAAFVGLAVFAVFWNGIVSIFVWVLASSELGGAAVFPILFLIPFVLVGLFVMGLAIRQGLALTNPQVRVDVSKPVVALGEELHIDWSMTGRVEKLARLTFTLEGREQASYRRGTDTMLDVKMFANIPIAEQTGRRISRRGSERVTIPAGTMHSFDAPSNKIIWTIRVRGEIPRWPDSDDEFPITVAPLRLAALASDTSDGSLRAGR